MAKGHFSNTDKENRKILSLKRLDKRIITPSLKNFQTRSLTKNPTACVLEVREGLRKYMDHPCMRQKQAAAQQQRMPGMKLKIINSHI